MNTVYNILLQRRAQGKKSLAVLVDPDKTAHLAELLHHAKNSPPDFFFVGGSLLSEGNLAPCIRQLKSIPGVPVVLFPGSAMQVCADADALLLLSVISGRNPDLLIGRHVLAAPMLKQSGLELIPTGYILVESGAATTVSYITNTQPVPRDKNPIAACTAMAGEQLGLKLIYLEAGSGAQQPVPVSMVEAVRRSVSVPVITGGGLRTAAEIGERFDAGADLIVTGNILEQSPGLLPEFCAAAHATST
jgi:putative glycerol-1-phosphate prenyltransferase